MSDILIDRVKAKNDAIINGRNNDMKQHADKLIQGFQKLTDIHAKRAIWELFQNAIDLAEHAKIIIKLSNDAISFKHNGKTFDNNTLDCLIKQVSSKSPENNDEEIGQYGTGFISTHSFGRKILLSGSLQQNGYYIPLKDFEIDRTPKTSPDLIKNLITQQDVVFDLIENGEYKETKEEYTEFAFQTKSDLEIQYAKEALNDIPIILPYVLVLNERLQEVLVIDKENHPTRYEKGLVQDLNGIKKSEIKINGESHFIYSTSKKDEESNNSVTVILPIKQNNNVFEFHEKLSRLFLFYPLIGTENLGINFIIHSKQFAPTEQRDGIHLRSKTEQVQEEEKNNRKLLKLASSTIFSFVEKYAKESQNPIYYARINFKVTSEKPLLDSYLQKLKNVWINNFLKYPLVESKDEKINPSATLFLSDELLPTNPLYFNSIYSLTSKFYTNIPNKNIVREWTKTVNEWDTQKIKKISINDLVDKIKNEGNLNKFDNQDDIRSFYQYLLELEKVYLFNHHELLPNIKGEFKKLPDLRESINIPYKLIEIADVLLPEISKKQIHPDYKFSLELSPYNRKEFSNELNAYIQSTLNDTIDFTFFLEKKTEEIEDETLTSTLYSFIDYCKIATSIDSESAPAKMLKIICDYLKYDSELIEIPAIKDDIIELRASQKKLVNIFLNDLKTKDSEWVDKNLDMLKKMLALSGKDEFKDLFLKLPAFPNQNNELCIQGTLKVDNGIPKEIKDYYDQVVKSDLPIRSSLVLDGFSEYLQTKSVQTINGLTNEIESVFTENGQYSNISDHPFKRQILAIINKITTDSDWGNYFPILNGKRANVMLETISDETTKDDVFSIITLESSKILQLGQLARNPNLSRIIELGQIALNEESKQRSDFDFKHAIGKKIESLIKVKIDKELEDFKVDVEDVQNGQDIIIRMNKKDLYYIEVKSRWNSDSSIMMSKNQFTNAADNKEIYSLCCVEMSDYKVGEEERYQVDDVNIIFDRIKIINTIGDELEPLISGMLITTDAENEITLTGDYKATIPQRIIKTGTNIDEFVDFLIKKLNLTNI
ncbi:sacsin N-terminal ATP-binding-like domain-containing protein [uncultured Draconibacterium sp.]|uniref:sacsin N-terminal ATP-binding-like domain-containing protein n=1 Tax=uncultured Draconibacterium sp. TaxID=1573823 RepID=UPI0032608C2F